jgi:hypothetical protein
MCTPVKAVPDPANRAPPSSVQCSTCGARLGGSPRIRCCSIEWRDQARDQLERGQLVRMSPLTSKPCGQDVRAPQRTQPFPWPTLSAPLQATKPYTGGIPPGLIRSRRRSCPDFCEHAARRKTAASRAFPQLRTTGPVMGRIAPPSHKCLVISAPQPTYKPGGPCWPSAQSINVTPADHFHASH